MTHPYLFSILHKTAQQKIYANHIGLIREYKALQKAVIAYHDTTKFVHYKNLCVPDDVFVQRVFELVYESVKTDKDIYELFKMDALNYYENDLNTFKSCIKSKRRVYMIVKIRHLICYIIRVYAYLQLQRIGEAVGYAHHTKVINAISKVNNILSCKHDLLHNFFLSTIEKASLNLVGLFDNEGKADVLLKCCSNKYENIKTKISALFPYCSAKNVLNHLLIDLGVVSNEFLTIFPLHRNELSKKDTIALNDLKLMLLPT